jgi:predicted TIM-barrel fold metal-dependent hydrolase
MIIIDSQVHIWAPETPEKPWAKDDAAKPHRPEPLGHEELLREMNTAGVHRAIVVPPTWEADRNDTSLEAARLHPDRFAVMGRLPLDQSASRQRMATWKSQPGMLGIRVSFRFGRTQTWLDDGTADWFWDAAETYRVPVMVFAPQAVPKLGAIAAAHPGMRMIIDHMGLSTELKGQPLGPAVEAVINLARFNNVGVKASALPCYVNERYPFPSLHPHIRRVVEAFGPKRVFWGTDLSHLPCVYREAVTLFTEELNFLSSTDKDWIMGRALAEWLSWPLPEQADRPEPEPSR